MIGALGAAGTAALAASLRWHWWRPARAGTPILMYHQVGPHRPGSRLNRWRVTPRDFRRQMVLLERRGYRGVALRDLLDEPDAPQRRAVVTFDDGFDGIRTCAVPVLAEFGFSATVFVVAGKLGGVNDWDDETPGERLLDASSLRELRGAKIEVGSHGMSHRALPGLENSALSKETAGSRRVLEDVLGERVTTFCYPYGAVDERAVLAVREAGYRAATVIRSGIDAGLPDPWRLRRVPVRGTDPLLDFSLALTRGRSKF